MKKIIRNGLLMLAAAFFAASCADYNDLGGFQAEPVPDTTNVAIYNELAPVKSYINRDKYPNMTLGATLKVAEFNKQELAHAAAISNFDNLSFGTTLMSGTIVNEKGIMNFLAFKDLLDHVDELGAEVFGSPLAANTNQADSWLNTLMSPIKIKVDYVEDITNNFSRMETFNGTVVGGETPTFTTSDGIRCIAVQTSNKNASKLYLAEGFDVDPNLDYEISMKVKASKETSLTLTFAGNKLDKLAIKPTWKEYSFKAKGSEVTGNLLSDAGRFAGTIYYASVKIGHYPDDHRPQTAEEVNDTIHYALGKWCDGLMKINEGRITDFDLIEEAIDVNNEMENGLYGLKTSTDPKKIFWQDVLGVENYAPVVADSARHYFQKYGGDPASLKFYINESNLDDEKKFESLKYWLGVWDSKGANIQGISAKLSIAYYEDPEKQAEKKAAVDKMLDNLASTGKLIRICDFDIKYINKDGVAVPAAKTTDKEGITEEQRQNLADYYAYIIRSYMSRIPADKQAGICKGNIADTGDPVGLWSVNKKKDWERTATYKAFCDALSGE